MLYWHSPLGKLKVKMEKVTVRLPVRCNNTHQFLLAEGLFKTVVHLAAAPVAADSPSQSRHHILDINQSWLASHLSRRCANKHYRALSTREAEHHHMVHDQPMKLPTNDRARWPDDSRMLPMSWVSGEVLLGRTVAQSIFPVQNRWKLYLPMGNYQDRSFHLYTVTA